MLPEVLSDMMFNKSKSGSKADNSSLQLYRFAILGDCSTQHISAAIKGLAFEAGYNFDVFTADYGCITAEKIAADKALGTFAPQTLLIYMCTEKLYARFCECPKENRAQFAQTVFNEISACWQQLCEGTKVNVIQFNFAELDDGVFGSFAHKTAESFLYQLRRLNLLITEGCMCTENVYIADLSSIQNRLGRDFTYDAQFYYVAHMSLSLNALSLVSKAVFSIIEALDRHNKTCIVLDLDDTLWGVSPDKKDIVFGDGGEGRIYLDFQLWLREMKRRGVLLAVCSKCDENAAKAVFEKHGEMVLRLEDFSAFAANWDTKVHNISVIQKQLNIDTSAMVFLDDNPYDRKLVGELLPDLTVPDLPAEPAKRLDYIRSLNLFENISPFSKDDALDMQRRIARLRSNLKKNLVAHNEYLRSLELCAEVHPFDGTPLPQLSAFIRRTHKFDMRPAALSDSDMESIISDDKHIAFYVTLKDRFGDYGIIAAVVIKKRNVDTMFISSWMIDDSVLELETESFISNIIIEAIISRNAGIIIGEYAACDSNPAAAGVYEKLGYSSVSDGLFAISAQEYIPLTTYISWNGYFAGEADGVDKPATARVPQPIWSIHNSQ